MNRKFVVKLLSTIALTTLIVSVGGGTIVLAEGNCEHHEVAVQIGEHNPENHKVICDKVGCGAELRTEQHTNSGNYICGNNGHAYQCSKCFDYIGSFEDHTYDDSSWFVRSEDQGTHARDCKVCKTIDDSSVGAHDTDGPNGSCSKCGYVADPGCEPTPSTPEPEKEEKKEEKKESSSSSSSSKPAPSAPVTAETIRAAEGVTGSKEFVAKQTTMTSTVTNTVAALNNLAAINPAQANVLKNIGISLNAGGCTSFNANTAATLIKNNSIQYNLAFTWKNVSFRLVIPKGANISDLVDPVTGQLYFYKLVQRYGLAGCTLIK